MVNYDLWLKEPLIIDSRHEIYLTPEELNMIDYLRKPIRVCYEFNSFSKLKIYIPSIYLSDNNSIINNLFYDIKIKSEDLERDDVGFIFRHTEYVKNHLIKKFRIDIDILINDITTFIPEQWKKTSPCAKEHICCCRYCCYLVHWRFIKLLKKKRLI